ncbi:hypothetical protein DPMN_088638 [Dreissena polymorpha]|uniref:Uncharacterized protein n=1 Tax=Dreissena polymorpha TaxID=45954 RepID=A0A9D4KUG6_DREPO|nr:hypothetical protein DPMN_088638 [Dreissena polymorpha]
MFLPIFMTSEHPGSQVFQQTRTIFIHIQDIIKTNKLTNENARSTGGHVLQATGTTFKSVKNIIGTNLLKKFHDDRTINMASRVFTRKNATPLWRPYIIGTNYLTKFHDDRTINVASRVLTRKNAQPLIRKNAPPPGSHVFQTTSIIFELIQDIIGVNILTKFHDDRTNTSIYMYSHIRKNAPPLGSHVFQANVTIFEIIQDIIETNFLTKFHEDWTINVASRVFTRKNAPSPWQPDWTINVASRVLTRKTAPPPGGHVFSPIWTIFEKCPAPWQPYIIGMGQTNVASRVKNAPALGSHVFQANVTIFEIIQDFIETNFLTKFHEDWAINVASRVFTRKNAPPPWQPDKWTINVASRVLTRKTAPPPGGHFHDDWAKIVTSRVFTRNTSPPSGGHVFQRTESFLNSTNLHDDWASNVTSTVFTSFELSRGINGTNVLTKFHEDQTINVASRVFTRQNVDDGRCTTDDTRWTKSHHKSSP